jgi:hypothetical protein
MMLELNPTYAQVGLRMMAGILAWFGTPLSADPGALPPIFVPRSEPVAIPVRQPASPSPVSARVRELLTGQVLAKIPPFNSTVSPTWERPVDPVPASVDSDAVTMEKVLVSSSTLRLDLSRPLSPLQKFLRQGLFYQFIVGRIEMDGEVKLDRFYSDRQGSGGTETRAEVRFNFRW